ncbi:hypothetical protein [Chlorobium sp.]|uniref:hypothetical protein n=1 Tax=Chlorobium sp. TaxID=1095 RepID=UPI003C63FB0A
MAEEICCTDIVRQDERLKGIEERMSKGETSIEKLCDKLESNTRWLIGLFFSETLLLIAALGLLLKISGMVPK